MNRLLLFFISIYLCSACQPAARLDMSRRVEILVKDTALYRHIWIDHEGVSMFATPAQREQLLPESKLYFDEFANYEALSSLLNTEELLKIYTEKGIGQLPPTALDRLRGLPPDLIETDMKNPLAGKKIAIDPVHIGGSDFMAALEGKLLRIRLANGDTLRLDEGLLTLTVARIMEAKLRKLGAKVLLTRSKVGETGVGKTFEEWMKADFRRTVAQETEEGRLTQVDAKFLLEKAKPAEIYQQFFSKIDMRARAKKINAFRPDATIMVHFNVHKASKQLANGEMMKATDENYGLAYVPGAFMAGELYTPRDRMDMQRLISTSHLDESIRLARILAQAMHYELQVPPITQAQADGLSYLEKTSIAIDEGVYARNLTMTRWVRSPLCYVEPLCLNNAEECVRLAKKEVKIGELVSSKRIEQVADAYIAGLRTYFGASDPTVSPEDLVEQEL